MTSGSTFLLKYLYKWLQKERNKPETQAWKSFIIYIFVIIATKSKIYSVEENAIYGYKKQSYFMLEMYTPEN